MKLTIETTGVFENDYLMNAYAAIDERIRTESSDAPQKYLHWDDLSDKEAVLMAFDFVEAVHNISRFHPTKYDFKIRDNHAHLTVNRGCFDHTIFD